MSGKQHIYSRHVLVFPLLDVGEEVGLIAPPPPPISDQRPKTQLQILKGFQAIYFYLGLLFPLPDVGEQAGLLLNLSLLNSQVQLQLFDLLLKS